ncbi:hypothetical protein [Mycobacterium sp. 3519A]|nr:hypothetical protein [Mycobacterium sp. 3519A]
MLDDLPPNAPEGGAVTLPRAAGIWSWAFVAFGVAIVVLGGFVLS